MRCRLIVALGLTMLAGCRKKNFDSVQLIGHAGSGLGSTTAKYSPNSAEAISYAVNVDGINGCEVDCQLSADGTIWLFHDVDLGPSSTGSGCINNKTDGQLSDLFFKSFSKEKLIKLKDLDFPYGKKSLLLDIRHANLCENVTINFNDYLAGIQEALAGKDVSQVCVITLDRTYAAGFVAAGFKTFYQFVDFSEFYSLPSGITGVSVKQADITDDQADIIRNAGLELMIFEVRSPKSIRKALRRYPHYLLVDDINTAIIEKY